MAHYRGQLNWSSKEEKATRTRQDLERSPSQELAAAYLQSMPMSIQGVLGALLACPSVISELTRRESPRYPNVLSLLHATVCLRLHAPH
jgi:hypothetical protein